MTEVKHTPLVVGGHSGRMIFNNIGTQIANCGTQEEAHMFVKCVNMHDELVEALSTVWDGNGVIDTTQWEVIREALKKAGAL